ncbi:hypothetical protein HF086_016928 [Spodoptera exigua]|uniref:Uncharacterized protein n=1 Tax=Spodoptera exigua TaxID=7107 RepID=A0A922MGL2_SPOEX|nr:hypothetical protein HF086_016928 [Spodoptera exigua]
MVKLTEETPFEEPIEELDQNGVMITNSHDYMAFLREQLEEVLPPHDKKQDEFLHKLTNLVFLPNNADEDMKKVYEELQEKQIKLQQLQKERVELTDFIRNYYNLQRNITQEECKREVDTLFRGKQEFFVVSKQLEELLYKLHGRGRL